MTMRTPVCAWIFRIFNELHVHVMSCRFGVINKKGGVFASFNYC